MSDRQDPGKDSSPERVSATVDDGVALVVVDSPPHNFLTESLLRELADVLGSLAGQCRSAVLASNGRSFCAGANFRSDDAPDPGAGGSFESSARQFYAQAIRVFAAEVPLVAAIQGPAIGAGLGLALACDMRVMSEKAWVQANFVRLGIHPGFGISYMLERLAGLAGASDLLLTGRRVGAAEALGMGLVNRVAAEGSELEVALEVAGEIAAGAPLAVSATRATLRGGLVEAIRQALDHELAEQSLLAGSADALEGVMAMLEKRRPRFKGS